MNNVNYRFYIDDMSCNPIWTDNLELIKERETEQYFFRTKLNGNLKFQNKDFDYIYNVDFNHEFKVRIEEKNINSSQWTPFFNGKFVITDCSVDLDNSTIITSLTANDEYDNVLNNEEKEFNLIDLQPDFDFIKLAKRGLLQTYIPGDNVLTCCISGSYWEQQCNIITDGEELNRLHFILSNRLVELEIVLNDTSYPRDIGGLYVGTLNKNGNYFNGIFTRPDNKYILNYYEDSTNNSWHYELIEVSTQEILYYRITGGVTNPQNRLQDGLSLILRKDGQNSTVTANFKVYYIWQRMLLDVATISWNDIVYPIPENDIIENNLNYRYMVGYANDINTKISNTFSYSPTEWGKNRENQYYLPPDNNYYYYPVSRSMWGLTSVWFFFTDEYWRREEEARRYYNLRHASPLSSVIKVLLKEIAPNLQHEETYEYSQFLYNSVNPVTGKSKDKIFITQKTNILHGEYDRPADRAIIKFKDITEMLKNVYKCYWYIRDNKFIIEHISFFKNGLSYLNDNVIGYDLINSLQPKILKSWGTNYNKWTYDKENLPDRYEFKWMDTVTKFFEGYPIQTINNYSQKGNIESINVSNFVSDIDLMIMNPNSFSTEGFALIATKLINNEYSTKIDVIIHNNQRVEIQNGSLSYYILHYDFFRYDLSTKKVIMNEIETEAINIIKGKVQNVKFPYSDMFDHMRLVKTFIGDGQVRNLSLNLSSRILNITLEYVTE